MIRLLRLVFIILWLGAGFARAQITVEDRKSVFNAVLSHLEQDYVDPDVGRVAADKLRSAAVVSRLNSISDGKSYAEAMSHFLQEFTGDGHLNIEYFSDAIEQATPTSENFEQSELQRYYGAHLNFGVEKVARLDGNIGLLDLRVFAPVDMGGNTVAAAMNVVAHSDGLIIDLRENGGGMGDMADLVASYLFGPEREPLSGMYDRPSDTLTQRFTQAYVPGDRFGPDKPVYVLISPRTFSAAEALAYNLQALGRAEIVGEPSGGGAHPFEYLPIHEHFVLWSVTAKSVNPITNANWQGVGVQPDIFVPAAEALDEAISRLKAGG